jgi:2-keto-4-pentenoate hydratase/2-oxohepta-3-ene-1,7-dioic acid hydratase in catechol pathway
MRIIRYQVASGDIRQGCVSNEKIYRLEGGIEDFRVGDFADTLSAVHLLAPCVPRKVVAVARNFLGKDEFVAPDYEPIFFVKTSNTVCGSNENILNPFPKLPMWGEPELAVVIGRTLDNAKAREVRRSILGFTVANEVTVENIEGRDHHLARSKCVNNFCPIGPWIDTEFDATDCLIEGLQNGKVVRRGRSSEHILGWLSVVEKLSAWMKLEPWDIVLTGNPPDISGGMTTDSPGMKYLETGQTYKVRIEGLGEIENTIVFPEK